MTVLKDLEGGGGISITTTPSPRQKADMVVFGYSLPNSGQNPNHTDLYKHRYTELVVDLYLCS